MPSAPGKSDVPDTSPGFIRSLGFGAMLVVWWVATFEFPGHILFKISTSNWVSRGVGPLTAWAWAVTEKMIANRVWGAVAIIAVVILHAWLWRRYSRWDIYGKWLFKAGFVVLYIVLYTIFILVFLGAELPIWTWPAEITDMPAAQ